MSTERERACPVGFAPAHTTAIANHLQLVSFRYGLQGFVAIRVNRWANTYVANEGFMEGKAVAASRYRAWLRANDVAVFANVDVKHGAHMIGADRAFGELTQDAEFFDADAVILTARERATAPGSTSSGRSVTQRRYRFSLAPASRRTLS